MIVANGKETVVVIPVIVEVVQVRVPPAVVLVQFTDMAIAAKLGDRTCKK